jgi:hypothetical protein
MQISSVLVENHIFIQLQLHSLIMQQENLTILVRFLKNNIIQEAAGDVFGAVERLQVRGKQ